MTQLAVTSSALAVGAHSHGISFFNPEQFAHAQRVANMFASSALVPKDYQNNVANCVLALDIAERTGTSPLMVMQNLYMIHGKPSWSSAYIIASMNTTGKFTPLRYEMTDLGALPEALATKAKAGMPAGMAVPTNKQCVAYAWELNIRPEERTRENRLDSAPVSVSMALQEGWWNKSGSKWPIMTDLMLRYRAATLFGRMYAPEKLMGMPDAHEAQDSIIDIVDANDPMKRAAIDEKLEPGAGGDKPRTRRSRGASAAATGPEVTVSAEQTQAETTSSATVAEGASAGGSATVTPQEQTTTAQPEQTAGASGQPEAPKNDTAKVRTMVESAEQKDLPESRIVTLVKLKGEEFTGEAFYEGALIKFAPDGSVIDAVIERRPHRTQKDKFINVILSYEIVG